MQRLNGIRFIPAVQWVERGWMKPGNSVPRYHVPWGSSRHMVSTLLQALRTLRHRDRLQWLTRHRADHNPHIRDRRPLASAEAAAMAASLWKAHFYRDAC